ncbi:hypothetical protein [Mangrovimonas aestuarii]|uniref:hypothetical protein n=1 Tax=Mangrovimonas aestuarii TaxID=3018443 RepID=UPI002378941A|nr:hypothetical protein [Mangrovimonas aestuarii]
MKGNLKANKIITILSIFGIVVLLLLSPCKVRNFIQAEIGIPLTKVLNKSQSTISQSNCQTFQFSEINQNNSKPTFQQFDLLISEIFWLDFTSYSTKHPLNLTILNKQQATNVPLYILYQNLKIHS